MTMNKRNTIRGVAQSTSLTHRQAQTAVEALISLWTAELAQGGKIAIDDFLILEVKTISASSSANPLSQHHRD